jgi:integrase
MVFADPTRNVHTGQSALSVPTPVDATALASVAAAARNNRALRVVIALGGVHALHPGEIRALLLADIDLPNRRLHRGDGDRPLDEFTAAAVAEYLAERRSRWPNTGNPHLLITRRTAHDHEPVSAYWLTTLVRDLPITLAQLRPLSARRHRLPRVMAAVPLPASPHAELRLPDHAAPRSAVVRSMNLP